MWPGQWVVKDLEAWRWTPRLGKRPGAQDRVSPRGKEVADKGRRSFLRRAEGQGKYNAGGTGFQCLFNCKLEEALKVLKGFGLLIRK